MLKEVITILIAFSGVLFGILFQKVTEREIKPGRKYFIWVMRCILLVLVVLLLYFSWKNYWIIISFILGALVASFFRIRYFYLGLALVASLLASINFFIIVAGLILMYGLAFGSLMEDKKKIILEFVLFLIPFLLLFFNSVNDFNYLLLAFVAGSLFLRR